MSDFTAVARGPFTIVDDGRPPELSESLRSAVDTHWETAVQRNPRLFDADIFVATEISDGRVTGCFLPYRYNLALFEDRVLRIGAPVTVFGVVGITRTADGAFLIARRAGHVTAPGTWEVAPAGGLDRSARRADGTIDALALLLNELTEETGIPADAVTVATDVAVIHRAATGDTDIVFECSLALTRAEVETAFAQRTTTEYDALRCWSPGDPVDDALAAPVAYLRAAQASVLAHASRAMPD